MPGVAFCLKPVIEVIGLLGYAVDIKLRKIRICLKLNGDDVDLFVVGNVGTRMLGKNALHRRFVVAVRPYMHGIGYTVDEGIHKSL